MLLFGFVCVVFVVEWCVCWFIVVVGVGCVGGCLCCVYYGCCCFSCFVRCVVDRVQFVGYGCGCGVVDCLGGVA